MPGMPSAHVWPAAGEPVPPERSGEASTTSPDVFCPHCGYNLREIPEERCPECGFGYDHRGIRSLSTAVGLHWDQACRRSMASATIAAAFALPLLLNPAGADELLALILTSAVIMAAWVVVRRLRDPRPPELLFDSLPIPLMLPVTLALGFVVVWFPGMGMLAGTAAALRAWWIYLRAPRTAPFAEMNLRAEDRAFLLRRHVVTVIVLGAASLAVLAAWVP